METNIVTPGQDADMSDCDGEKVVTMMDVLREQEDFENDANAVLGASDEKNCTYEKGYIKRQAIYACMTCCAEAKTDPTKRAGVCLACSLTCHEDHELIELYTKRNFRCDCGSAKFNSHPCHYSSAKTDLNENNEYNQNFSGLYCVCKRPYPDLENSIEDEMIQCIICEDWLHGSHLEATLPPNDEYSEMICKNCMERNLFLHDYSNFAVNVKDNDIDVLGDNTENSIINNDVNNETFKDIDAIQKSPCKDGEEDIAGHKNRDVNASVKDGDYINDMTTYSNKSVDEQDLNSETVKNNESNSKSNEIDPESVEEDRLLADPEDGIEELSKQRESAVVDDKKNKNASDEQDSKVLSDDIKNKGDHTRINNKTVTDTNDNKESDRSDNAKTLKEKFSGNLDEENNTITEQDETYKTPDEKHHSEIDNECLLEKKANQNFTIDDKQNEETTTTTKSNENTIQNAPETELQGNLEEANVFEKSGNNMEDCCDSKVDVENNIDVSDKVQTSIESDTNNSDLSECNETVAQNSINTFETDKDDKNNIEKVDIQKINENDLNYVNSSEANTPENKRKHSTEENTSIADDSGVSGKRIKLDSNCIRPKNVKRIFNGATFWPSDFRQKLCTCNECLVMYKDLSVLFLTDFEDTVRAYESLGEEKERIEGKPASQYEKGLQALSSLDRIQQINALTAYNNMKDKLVEYLKGFQGQVVKEEDIKEFFAGMKPKREPDGVYFCR